MQIFQWYQEQNSKAQTNNISISNHFFEWVLLYSHVADFALRKTSFKGSYLCAGSVLANSKMPSHSKKTFSHYMHYNPLHLLVYVESF